MKVFVPALAIADDSFAVSVIALFYTDRIHFISLLLSAVGIVVCFVANVLGVRKPLP
jgi:NhaA family Na+:H+ antiporter